MVILADTSAWVEFDRATGSEIDERLTALIRDGGPLAVTEPVICGAETFGVKVMTKSRASSVAVLAMVLVA